MVKQRLHNNRKGLAQGVILFFMLIVFLIFIFGGFYIIDAGERGVVLTFGKPHSVIADPGFHFKKPIIDKVVKFETRTQKYESPAAAASYDLQDVETTIVVNFRIKPEQVVEVYQTLGLGYADRVINPIIQDSVKASTAQFTAAELITKRVEVGDKIKTIIAEKLEQRDFIVEEISITNFKFSDTFTQSIENKVKAEQDALAAKNKLAQVEYEAQQRIAEANGKAQAIEIESKALQQNRDILQLRAIERWDGKLPAVVGGATPFIDVSQFSGGKS